MREDRKNYILVGVFVIAMLASLILWIALLSGRTGATDSYHIRYDDVLGLSAGGTRLYFDGYPIGMIESIERPADGDPQQFMLGVAVERGWKIPTDSIAKITASGLLAAVVVNIEGGSATTYLEPGDRIPSEEATNLMAILGATATDFSEFLVETLKPQISVIVADLRMTMDQVKALLSDENTSRVATILANIEGVSQDVESLAGNIGNTQSQFDAVLLRIDKVLADVGELVAANESDITGSVKDLNQTLAALARHADAIATNLEVTTRNMDEFSAQIRDDPGVLLRGREAAKEPGTK